MRFSRLKAAIGGSLLLFVSSLPASAGLVTLETADSGSVFGTPNYSSPVTITSPRDVTANAGPFRVNNITTGELNLVAWCIDLFQSFGVGQTNYLTGTQLVSDERLGLLDRLFTQYLPSVESALTGAAMQVAVWEIVNETARDAFGAIDFDVHADNFQVVVDAPTNLANDWLNDISRDTTAGGFVFDFFKSDDRQDLLIAKANPNPPAVPLPAAAWMLMTAVGGVAGMRKLRKAA